MSTVFSTINSLTLSPALAALLLRPRHAKPDLITRLLNLILGWPFRIFNFGVRTSTKIYLGMVGKLLRVPALVLAVYGGLLFLTYWGYQQLPTGFIPSQDKGYLVAAVQLPDAASAERTRAAMAKMEDIAKQTPGIKNVYAIAGNSFVLSAYGSNFGSMFLILNDFNQRRTPDLTSDAIIGKLMKRFSKEIPEAFVLVFPPPAVAGLGRAGGFKFMVEDRGGVGLVDLQTETDKLVAEANKAPGLMGLSTVYKANSPQLFVDVNREACLKQGVSLDELFGTLQAYLGSRYVNDFNRFGHTWQVIVQADPQYRNQIDDVSRLKVRNGQGQMVPLGSLVHVRPMVGPLVLTRYNMYPAAGINGNVAKGFSTGQASKVLEDLAKRELPPKMSYEWTEITFLEQKQANTGMIVFGFSVIFVFLVLAALYESWSLPLAVILVVPMCVLCSIFGVWLADQDINVFTQVGFVVLIGLACKNAILIVEFAKLKRESGVSARDATLQACELRLRPILMTSFAFILGVVPLVVATGAGAEMRRVLGTAVFSGMLGVTLFGIFLTPIFFWVIDHTSHWRVFTTGPLASVAGIFIDTISLRPVRNFAGHVVRERTWGKMRWPSTQRRKAVESALKPREFETNHSESGQRAVPQAELAGDSTDQTIDVSSDKTEPVELEMAAAAHGFDREPDLSELEAIQGQKNVFEIPASIPPVDDEMEPALEPVTEIESELPEMVADVSPPATVEPAPAAVELIPPPLIVSAATATPMSTPAADASAADSTTTIASSGAPKPHKVHLDPIPVNWKPNPKLDPRKH